MSTCLPGQMLDVRRAGEKSATIVNTLLKAECGLVGEDRAFGNNVYEKPAPTGMLTDFTVQIGRWAGD